MEEHAIDLITDFDDETKNYYQHKQRSEEVLQITRSWK